MRSTCTYGLLVAVATFSNIILTVNANVNVNVNANANTNTNTNANTLTGLVSLHSTSSKSRSVSYLHFGDNESLSLSAMTLASCASSYISNLSNDLFNTPSSSVLLTLPGYISDPKRASPIDTLLTPLLTTHTTKVTDASNLYESLLTTNDYLPCSTTSCGSLQLGKSLDPVTNEVLLLGSLIALTKSPNIKQTPYTNLALTLREVHRLDLPQTQQDMLSKALHLFLTSRPNTSFITLTGEGVSVPLFSSSSSSSLRELRSGSLSETPFQQIGNETLAIHDIQTYQITLWLTVFLVVILAVVLLSMGCMDTNMDNMLLAKFKADTGDYKNE